MAEDPKVGGTMIVRVVIPEGYVSGDMIEVVCNLGDPELIAKLRRDAREDEE